MAAANLPDEREYKRHIRAWTLYDWANSAFATTVLAAVLPIYYSQVAGADLPSEATATSYWSLTLSAALLIAAVLSPILGTISDIMRGKKRFLAIFTGIGIIGTAALVLVGTGDWLLASIIMIVARVGFTGAYTFYDALLPHVAREEDRDVVSTRGYAMGYLGGGLLLAINVVMIFQLGFENGARLSFISVALWWIVFSIPLFRDVPEPPAADEKADGWRAVSVSFRRIGETIKDIRRYSELFKFLIAFLIYNDAIGTIIGVAAIYGTELGFDATQLILALLLVQFAGIPFSLIFGWLPSKQRAWRPFYLAFILFNLVALPIVGIFGAQVDPEFMSLSVILGALVGLQLLGLAFAWLIGQQFVKGLAAKLDTKSGILLALIFYSVIAMWGFVLHSPIEFWFLAWMVAIVQGGSQALSRSLYAAMSPASKSGEFFGLFGVMEKLSSFLGPLVFALAAALFGSSRPAILALIGFFIVGGYLLSRVNVEAGRKVAQAEDTVVLGN
jgi:UMF1 family MFS transporter